MAKISDKDWCWQQCATINNENPDVYRTDELGNKIRYASYGTNGEFGWHIDHTIFHDAMTVSTVATAGCP